MTDWAHTQTWPAERPHVGDARRFATRVLAAHEHLNLADDVQLVVSELVTNAVVHARSSFSLTITGEGDRVRVSVRDTGIDVPANTTVGTVMETRGRGMRIVEGHCAEWGVSRERDGGKSVWASFDVPARTFPVPG